MKIEPKSITLATYEIYPIPTNGSPEPRQRSNKLRLAMPIVKDIEKLTADNLLDGWDRFYYLTDIGDQTD
jgi:hypothetical protein